MYQFRTEMIKVYVCVISVVRNQLNDGVSQLCMSGEISLREPPLWAISTPLQALDFKAVIPKTQRASRRCSESNFGFNSAAFKRLRLTFVLLPWTNKQTKLPRVARKIHLIHPGALTLSGNASERRNPLGNETIKRCSVTKLSGIST